MKQILAIVGIALVAGIGFWVINQNKTPTPVAADLGGTSAGDTSAQSAESAETAQQAIVEMTLGNVNAPVKVTEYASYTCSHCGAFHREGFKDLKANYIDTGKVHFTYREVYFDRAALWASMVARCGGAEKFFGITDLIYKGQREWLGGGDPVQMADGLRKVGRVAGLSSETLDACLEDQDKAQALVEWFQANSEADGIESTPSFIVGEDRVIGNNYAKLRDVIDAQLGN
ncbi:DsbA family protein [uncultured Lentibacter sp.]|jgi:protein-disulfide isomerase|uniref:DsbA family protein n=1 Tax=uncultured Lentibacter sp. TaxID=1659309 RepID=UPI00263711D4|nr:DsbA family protein [uncultured Lentibacter sp.]